MSFEEQRPEFVLGSSSGRTSSQASGSNLPYSPTRTNSHDSHAHEDGRGRSKGKRLSSIGMFFDAVKERVRSVSRPERDITPSHSLSRSRDPRDHSPDRRDSSTRRGRTREPKERTALERVTEVLGLESDDDGSPDSWKEFRKGKLDVFFAVRNAHESLQAYIPTQSLLRYPPMRHLPCTASSAQ